MNRPCGRFEGAEKKKMKTINLLFAVHNHQPVGNFDRVFREGWEKCYAPFLEALERHPQFRISLHYSGSLLEWLEAHQPDFLTRLRALTSRGQVELISGGFYEPLLPFIPEKDAIGQVRLLNQYLQNKIGCHPRGFWLAERVWSTTLPKTLSATDLKYTLVDDSHFRGGPFCLCSQDLRISMVPSARAAPTVQGRPRERLSRRR